MTQKSWLWSFGPLAEIQVAINDVMQEIADLGVTTALAPFPETRMESTARGYRIEALVPGLERSEIEVSVAGQRVQLRGTRRRPRVAGRLLRAERPHGAFDRAVQLPDDADTGSLRARLADGVLTIDVPFRPQEGGGHIDIEVEGA